jgi:hypothetical protein
MPHRLYQLLKLLDETHLCYRLGRSRDETVKVTVSIVGERIEVEVFEDGHIEFSRFRGDESVESTEEEIERLFQQFTDER